MASYKQAILCSFRVFSYCRGSCIFQGIPLTSLSLPYSLKRRSLEQSIFCNASLQIVSLKKQQQQQQQQKTSRQNSCIQSSIKCQGSKTCPSGLFQNGLPNFGIPNVVVLISNMVLLNIFRNNTTVKFLYILNSHKKQKTVRN